MSIMCDNVYYFENLFNKNTKLLNWFETNEKYFHKTQFSSLILTYFTSFSYFKI